jgi:hypothetical protein
MGVRHACERRQRHRPTIFYSEHLMARNHLGDFGVGGKIILKWMLNRI